MATASPVGHVGALVGAHIIGPDAAEVLPELTLACRWNLTITDLVRWNARQLIRSTQGRVGSLDLDGDVLGTAAAEFRAVGRSRRRSRCSRADPLQ
ncbi:hypothetical protein [Nocardia salmonicida]|uniref:hypothetical protein n=1 Tax=Nocardia salmonicida TaxID=53431 RepID=UPI0033E4F8CF